MFGAEDPLCTRSSAANWRQAPAAIPRLPGPAGQVSARGQSAAVLGAESPCSRHLQQRG